MRAMGRHGFPGIPRRHAATFSLVAMVLREASALMRISSYNRRAERAPHLSYSGEKSSSYIYICFLYIYIYIYVRTSCTRALRANVGPAG